MSHQLDSSRWGLEEDVLKPPKKTSCITKLGHIRILSFAPTLSPGATRFCQKRVILHAQCDIKNSSTSLHQSVRTYAAQAPVLDVLAEGGVLHGFLPCGGVKVG